MSRVDWTVLELDGMTDLVKSTAESVARTHTLGMFTEEDLEQEGLLWCATNADTVRELHAREDKLLGLRLWGRLANILRPEIRHEEQAIGLHRLYDEGE